VTGLVGGTHGAIVPGVFATDAAAARLGAPPMPDAEFISLSDLVAPCDRVRRRLETVASADLVTVLYRGGTMRFVKGRFGTHLGLRS
jgi:precorrin-3B methylase